MKEATYTADVTIEFSDAFYNETNDLQLLLDRFEEVPLEAMRGAPVTITVEVFDNASGKFVAERTTRLTEVE